MEYNLAALRQRVLVDKLDDEEFDSGVVDRFINDTQRNIFNQYELPFMEKIFQGTIPAGVTMFKFPDDVALIQSHSVLGVPRFSDRRMDFRSFFQKHNDIANSPASTVLNWTLYAGNMLLSAPTDQEYTMSLFYIKKPTTLTVDTQVPDLPEEFSELLVLGAYLRILKRNEDFDLAKEVEKEYNDQLMLLVNRYGFREANGPIKMKNQQIVPRRRL
jgi:hypothetical protein